MDSGGHLVKGSAVSNLKRYIESRSEDLYDVLAKKYNLSSGSIILQSSWYNALDVYRMQDDAADHLGLSRKEMAVEVSRYSLEVDLAGIYRFFMRMGGAEQTLRNSPRIANRYVNFFEIKVVESSKGLFRCELAADPMFMNWSLWSNEGATRGTLKVCKSSLKAFNVLHESEELDHRNWKTTTYEVHY